MGCLMIWLLFGALCWIVIIAAIISAPFAARRERCIREMLGGVREPTLPEIETGLRHYGPQSTAEAIEIVRRLEALREKFTRDEQ